MAKNFRIFATKRKMDYVSPNLEIGTVPAPINGAASIQKLLFEPSDYHIKMTYKIIFGMNS